MSLQKLLGIELPVIQAPMAGVQAGALAIAVSNAGGLGSLPCAMLSTEAMAKELAKIKANTTRPFNVNFFCHTPPAPSAQRAAAWRAALAPYYQEFGIDMATLADGPGARRSARSTRTCWLNSNRRSSVFISACRRRNCSPACVRGARR
jgi:nitronate monooxygenase